MLLADVNVLVYAANHLAPEHSKYKAWVDDLINGSEPYAVSELVLSGVFRMLTNSVLFPHATTNESALTFVQSIRGGRDCVSLTPGPRHWDLFLNLCRQTNARGNAVPDAYHAALAIEHGCEWITNDRGFAKFPGLRWRHPFHS